MRLSKGFWIWGGFNQEENIYLNSIKDKVNNIFESPYFSNHITIAGPYSEMDIEFLESIKLYCKNNPPLRLDVIGYKCKNEKYQSFYISIKNSSKINQLRGNLFALKKFPIDRHFEPHISLAYGNHDLILKKKLIKKLPNLVISFNLSNLLIAKVDESINKWEIINKFDFAKS